MNIRNEQRNKEMKERKTKRAGKKTNKESNKRINKGADKQIKAKWLDERMYEKVGIGIHLNTNAIKELHYN